jgi:starch synthase (maltosyl-transferring)
VKTRPTDWEKPTFDLTRYIGEVNRMKASLPVLNEEGPQRALTLANGRAVCLLRRAMRGRAWTVVLINSDRTSPVAARIDGLDKDVEGGREVTPGRKDLPFHPGGEVTLAPGEVRVYANR